jgi:DnaJ-domain-containing protein 1
VDGFIDRLAEFLRGLMGDSDPRPAGRTSEGAGSQWRDPDLRAAWEELEDYLGGSGTARSGGAGGPGSTRGSASGTDGAGSYAGQGARARRPEPPVDESLRQDFANLEVPFGSDIETVRNSYKSLMLKYHPDKFTSDPEKQRVALEITKKINQSFERIRNRRG